MEGQDSAGTFQGERARSKPDFFLCFLSTIFRKAHSHSIGIHQA